MAKQTSSNIKLGFFVLAGLLIFVVSLYSIGKKKSFFGANFELKARFRNVNGLMKGNNVRFSGIQSGSVKDINILNDTTIEVIMLIDENIKNYIRKNSLVSIGSEGLMGNKIINIEPNKSSASPVEEDDMLVTSNENSFSDMLTTLSQTNNNIAAFSGDLKETIKRINNSKALWSILEDTSMSRDIRVSLTNFKSASNNIASMSTVLTEIIEDVKNGEGTAGLVLRDSFTARKLKDVVSKASDIANNMDATLSGLNSMVNSIHQDINGTNGIANAILKDSLTAYNFRSSLANIEKGAASFSEDMEALKHNFLFRKYFKKQARKIKSQN